MDNMRSFSRFTSVNPNIALHGATVEELTSVKGRPAPDPVASPMANQAVTDPFLGLTRARSSLGSPSQPAVNPYEGPMLTLILSRRAIKKLRGQVINDLGDLIESSDIVPPEIRERMANSMQRMGAMRDFIAYLNEMSDMVFAQTVGAQRG